MILSRIESIIGLCELVGAQGLVGHPLPGCGPWQLEYQQTWAKMQSSADLGHRAALNRLQISLPAVVRVRWVVCLGGGPSRAAMWILVLSRKSWLQRMRDQTYMSSLMESHRMVLSLAAAWQNKRSYSMHYAVGWLAKNMAVMVLYFASSSAWEG